LLLYPTFRCESNCKCLGSHPLQPDRYNCCVLRERPGVQYWSNRLRCLAAEAAQAIFFGLINLVLPGMETIIARLWPYSTHNNVKVIPT